MSLSEILHPRPEYTGETILDLLEKGCRPNPGKTAATVTFQKPDHLQNLHGDQVDADAPHLSWTFEQMRTAGLTVAWHFLQQNVPRGSTFATFLPNGIECLLRFWAAAALQLTIAPLDPGTTLPGRRDELRWYLDHLRPGVILVKDKAGAEAVDAAMHAQGLTAQTRLMVADVNHPGWTSLCSFSASQVLIPSNQRTLLHQERALEDNGERISTILFTSGTSGGRPKGCPIPVRATAFSSETLRDPEHRAMLMTFTNFRAVSNVQCFLHLLKGVEIILPCETLETTAVLDTIEDLAAKDRQVNICAVPAMLHYYASNPTLAGRNLANVLGCQIAGDMVTDDVVEKAKRIFPGALMTNGYGSTEACGTILPGDEDRVPRLRGVLAVGQIAPQTSVRVVDAADGHTLVKRGEVGDLHISGPGVISHYVHDVKADDFYNDDHGQWFKTGDHAILDEADWLFVLGRSKDIIKRSAVKLSPAVIEAVLNRHDGLTASVVAIPDKLHGEVPVAIVRQRNAHTVDSIKQIVLDEQGPDSALGDVVFLEELGLQDFLYNATGKILKTRLVELMTAYKHEKRNQE